MTAPTAKQWQRRALKAEAELELLHRMRQRDGVTEMQMARELATTRVALREAQESIAWALGEQS